MTDAGPRVVELRDRYVLEHGTHARVGVLEDLHRASTVDGT
jgi:hypothetical protein